MKAGYDLRAFAEEMDRQRKVKEDYRIKPGAMECNGGKLHVRGLSEPLAFSDTALQQVALYTGVPNNYLRKCRLEDKELFDHNVNSWLRRKDGEKDSRLVRVLDGKVRAFLSPRYRPIDNFEVANTVIQELYDKDFEPVSLNITDDYMYIQVTSERMQKEVKVGDIVQYGLTVSNSETGLGMVKVEPLIYRLVCTNGMRTNIADFGFTRRHIGARDNSHWVDIRVLSQEAIQADNKSVLLALRDTVKASLNPEIFGQIVETYRSATDKTLPAGYSPEVVKLSSKMFGLSESEGKGILDHYLTDHDFSLYGLGNAITRFSQDIDNVDRVKELEAIGWDVITLQPKQYELLRNAS